jgi:transcription termination factor Rho
MNEDNVGGQGGGQPGAGSGGSQGGGHSQGSGSGGPGGHGHGGHSSRSRYFRSRRRRSGGGGNPQHQHQPNQQHQQRRQQQGGGPRPAPQPVRTADEVAFMEKTPVDPHQWINLEKGSTDPSMRALDLLCPIGKGTRGLIVSPPKAGKTTFLKQISNAVHGVDPAVKQFCLLVDERPEEVTDFKRSVPAEVWASSSDQAYERHREVAENLMRAAISEAAKGADVLILLDSLTRLARVHNQFAVGNRTMSGGLDSRAMEIPRRFFGAARKLEEGGSLTILASILVDTGSRMDDIIFQEFKGTGNMELVLFRSAAEMRIFPALKVRDTGTRKEEKLLPPDILEGVYKLRRHLAPLGELDATKAMHDLLMTYKTNKALLASLK